MGIIEGKILKQVLCKLEAVFNLKIKICIFKMFEIIWQDSTGLG